MNDIWTTSVGDFLEIYEEAIKLGKERGKKEGDNLEQEFFEIVNKKKKTPKHIGQTEMDKDLLVGNLRENGHKILDIDELNRRKLQQGE